MQGVKAGIMRLSCDRIAIEAMRTLPPGVVTMALNNALWSVEEEAVVARIPSVSLQQLQQHSAECHSIIIRAVFYEPNNRTQ